MAAKAYPVQILVYVTQEQADALHAMTSNASEWARKHIDRDTKRQRAEAARLDRATQRKEQAK